MALITGAVVSLYAQSNSTINKPAEREKSAKEIAFTAAYRERDSTRALELGQQFLKDYPMEQADYKADKAAYIDYYRIYLRIITAHKAEVDARIKQYYEVLPYYAVAELAYRQVYLFNHHKLVSDANLLERSRLLINKIKSFQNHKPIDFADKTETEWNKIYDDLYFRNVLTHINILKNTGNTREGLTFADEALSRFGYGIASLNEDYVQLLHMDGQTEKVQQVLEASVHVNQATPLILEMLKKNYLVKHRDDAGFNTYVESLKSAEGKAELAKELVAKMIKKTLPAFQMYDGNGKLVSSKDWKGKVVVLDFFASWCAPCKAAFPGMKMAQEKFANDKNVVFYFIDTHETGSAYKEVVLKYIKDNNFPFNILFDNELEPTKIGAVAKLLNVTAIPRKMILDQNGVLRFDTDGYYGSPTKLADEIKIMVDLTKNAK